MEVDVPAGVMVTPLPSGVTAAERCGRARPVSIRVFALGYMHVSICVTVYTGVCI